MFRSYISEHYCDILYERLALLKKNQGMSKKKKTLRIFRIRFQTLRLIILSFLPNIVSDLTNYP